MVVVDRVEESVGFEARQGYQFGAVVHTGQHDAHHAVNVEKRKDARVRLLKGFCNIMNLIIKQLLDV